MRIGIDLGGTNVRMGVVNEGVVLKKIAEPCKADQPEEVIVNHLKEMIRQLINPEITSIGIGVPSIVDAQRGIVYNVANIPSWREVHLKDILEKEFAIPVAVNNDCNCFAIGEHSFGEGKPYDDIVCLALGTGVGAGIIIKNQLYCGKNTAAGEVGAFSYLDRDYEYYCSSHFFMREHGMSGKEAYERASDGDEKALKIWDEIGHHIGNQIKAILYAYDPQAIIFGGSISRASHFFEKTMHESLHNFPYPEMIKNLRLHVSSKEDISLLGAAMLV